MTSGLPDDLVRSKNPYAEQDERAVAKEDLLKLWRAYSVSKRAISNGVGFRLEQLFWRILGSQHLQESLTGRHIAMLHAIIIRNEPIRTTPKASLARVLPNPDSSTRPVPQAGTSLSTVAEQSDPPTLQIGDDNHRRAFVQAGRDRSTSRPRPILRVPGIEAASSGKSARILTPTWGRDSSDKGKAPEVVDGSNLDDQSRSIQRSGFGTRTIDFAPASRGSLAISPTAISPKSGKKTPSFAVPWKKRRPSMPTRRSSQSVSGSSSKSPRTITLLSATPEQPSLTPVPRSDQDISSPHIEQVIDDSASSASFSSMASTTRPSKNSRAGSESGLRLLNSGLSSGSRTPIATKSSLTTGLSTSAAIAASLQPYADNSEASSRRSSGIIDPANPGMQVDLPTVPRSMSNLSLLLQKDRRKASKDS